MAILAFPFFFFLNRVFHKNFFFVGKTLAEWRQAESKSKKQSFLCARENEKLQDAMLDVRNNRNTSTLHLHHHNNHKNLSDKETAKVSSEEMGLI